MTANSNAEMKLFVYGFGIKAEYDKNLSQDIPNIFILYDRDGRKIDRLEGINYLAAINHFYDNAKALIYE